MYTWVFEQYADYFSIPNVIFTDGDEQMKDAIIAVYLTLTIHLRCVWHIWKNFFQKFKSCFSADKWNVVSNKFWKIAKTSDIAYCDIIETDWNEMIQFMKGNAACEISKVSIYIW